PQPPIRTSGIRIGTPAITTRGLAEAEMGQIAAWIVEVLQHIDDTARQQRIAAEVADLCRNFPVPADMVATR
ncbi:MAG: serine hydroxymethyltransferase, partial [Oscillochloris sp.]|nr:serine hydroxymethyltransferase [Oscillochloris sp.]